MDKFTSRVNELLSTVVEYSVDKTTPQNIIQKAVDSEVTAASQEGPIARALPGFTRRQQNRKAIRKQEKRKNDILQNIVVPAMRKQVDDLEKAAQDIRSPKKATDSTSQM